MLVRLDAWTDFTCPFCFLATLTLDRLYQENQVDLHWRAYQLRPSAEPMIAVMRTAIEKEHVRVGEIARAQYGLLLRPGPIGIGTRDAHIATKFAESHDRGNQFHLAAMKAYWLEGRSLEGKNSRSLPSRRDWIAPACWKLWRTASFAALWTPISCKPQAAKSAAFRGGFQRQIHSGRRPALRRF